MSMLKIFSDEWFEKFMENINNNENYKNYAHDWEGDIILFIVGDQISDSLRAGLNKIVRLKLYHGKCISLEFLKKIPEIKDLYVLEGKANVWENILSGKTDIITAILKGEIKVTGNMKNLIKYIAAARELVKSAQNINLKV